MYFNRGRKAIESQLVTMKPADFRLFYHPDFVFKTMLLRVWLLFWCIVGIGQVSLAQNGRGAGNTRNGIGPGGRYYPVHSIRDDWQVYDEANKAYIPFIVEQHSELPSVSAFIDLESNRNYKLLVWSEEDCYVFLDAALKQKLPGGSWLVMSIDSLYKVYRKPQLFLTLYGPPGIENKQAFIGYPKSASQKAVVLSDDNLSVLPRPHTVYDDFFGLALIFLLGTHAFLFTFFRRPFLSFFSLHDLFALRLRDEQFVINKQLNRATIAFTLNLSFVIGFLIMFVQDLDIDVFASRTLMLQGRQLPSLIIDFFLVSGIAFLLMMGKYVALQSIGSLYRLESITNLHYFKILQASSIFFPTIAILLTALVFNIHDPASIGAYLQIPFIIFYVGRLVLLYVVFTNAASVKSLYLISYLCIVELVPLLIGVRFAL